MQGDHARALYPCILDEAHRALEGIPVPSVLDVGCGTGMLSEQLLSAFPSCRLTGVDLSPAMVERARARLAGRAEVREADAERLPFHDGAFDLVVCNDSFHHCPDPDRAAFQMWRVLRKGGALVLGDVWQPAPARAMMNAWMPFFREGGCAHLFGDGASRDFRHMVPASSLESDWAHGVPYCRKQGLNA